VRYRLEPLEDHDPVLAAEHARRSPPEREAVEVAYADFVAKVVAGGSNARISRSA
jgi:hypothetical protein